MLPALIALIGMLLRTEKKISDENDLSTSVKNQSAAGWAVVALTFAVCFIQLFHKQEESATTEARFR